VSGGDNRWSKVEHSVVRMLENRSFDNVLGWLYDPANEAASIVFSVEKLPTQLSLLLLLS
jgi:phospholipase C